MNKKTILYTLSILALGIAVGIFLNTQNIFNSSSESSSNDPKLASSDNASKVSEPIQSSVTTIVQTSQSKDSYWISPDQTETTVTETVVETVSPTYQTYTITLPPQEYVTTPSGYQYAVGGRAVDGGPVNPHWTMGSNGLWQNPNVDPPSARRRSSKSLQ